jgi:hypothetical protein
LKSYRRAALVAGVSNALYVCWIVARYFPTIIRQHELASVGATVFALLISLPPVAMLVVLYWTDATLILSARGWYVAIALALLGGVPGIEQLYEFTQTMRIDWANIQSFEGITVAAKIANWLPNSNAFDQLGTLLSALAQQSIVFFLIVLVLRGTAVIVDISRSDLLHDVAMLATIAAAIILALGLIGQVYMAFQYDYYKHLAPAIVGTRWQFAIRNASSLPKAVFPLVFALIVLRSLAPAFDNAQRSSE